MSKIGWKLLLTNKDSAFALASCALGIFNITFFQGFLTPELLKYNLTEGSAGLIMSITSVAYLTGCLLYPRIFRDTPRKI